MADPVQSIEFFQLPGRKLDVKPAPVAREWMDQTPQRFAYRCLPLNIANSYGWEISSPSRFRVRWSGGDDTEALKFRHTEPRDPPAVSHFGSGIISFHVPALIRTPPGVALFVGGPVNSPKPGITPLSGIVETDWLPFTFTMNWKMDDTDRWVTFEKGEPFCVLFPVRLDDIEAYQVEMKQLEDAPELQEEFNQYYKARTDFITGLKQENSPERQRQWQKDYFRGVGAPSETVKHRTSLNLAKPVEKGRE